MGRPSVLIADDDAFSRKIVASKLAALSADVLEAADGLEALHLLNRSRVDVLILDLEMPKLNGYDLLGCIRGMDQHKHLPVVVLTAKEDRGSLERALIAGATSFLLKPLNWAAFGGHIRHLLAISRSARTVTARCEGASPAAP
jgi:CheY-like chemotaxis protein